MPDPVDIVEALLFASDAPLEPERIREVLDLGSVDEARTLVGELRSRYEEQNRALSVTEVAGGYRMVTRPDLAPWLVRLARARTRVRLSRAALEALAIVGYKQPVSRPEIDAIRGVNSEGVLDSLMERRLVRIAGRKEARVRSDVRIAEQGRLVTQPSGGEGDVVVPPVERRAVAADAVVHLVEAGIEAGAGR